jgi:RNA polymerase sigma-70 factor (ECF subfamily)
MEDPYRSILVMREIQGLQYQEICDALEIPLNTMKVYLHRGRRVLREALKGMYHHDDV